MQDGRYYFLEGGLGHHNHRKRKHKNNIC